ncbi:MAG: ABC transporter permease [Sphaerochaetaceae bacterium]|jgi:peptide/nickel transport system permease protein|nr:ABC transporter permease [Sphaerochaetaceae bacterium]MDD4219328.1 ABC transporter permease [Sphaerochaetaceae bacterium]
MSYRNETLQSQITGSKDIPIPKRYVRQTQTRIVLHNLSKNKGAMVGLFIIMVIVFIAIFADVLLDYETDVVGINISQRLLRPSWKHPCGTDDLGRDIFYRILYGARFSVSVGVVATTIGLGIGVIFGAIAGYYCGLAEDIIMRVNDIVSAVPSILMGIVIVSALGATTFNLMLAIGITSIPQFVRITRASVLSVRNQEYIEALYASGMSEPRIIAFHVLPNCLSPIIVQATLRIASAIIAASSLSFLGLGVPVPAPEWGSMLSMGRQYVRSASYLTIFPGLAILITVLSFNLLGDGLRDALDPKLKK